MFIPMKENETKCAFEKMDPEFLTAAADTLRLLAHPDRLRIVDALNTFHEMKVCDLTEYLGIAQSATSQHLNQMRRLGLLQTERRGKESWYSIGDKRAVGLVNFLCNCSQKNR